MASRHGGGNRALRGHSIHGPAPRSVHAQVLTREPPFILFLDKTPVRGCRFGVGGTGSSDFSGGIFTSAPRRCDDSKNMERRIHRLQPNQPGERVSTIQGGFQFSQVGASHEGAKTWPRRLPRRLSRSKGPYR